MADKRTEAERETRRRDRLEKEVRDLKTALESKQSELKTKQMEASDWQAHGARGSAGHCGATAMLRACSSRGGPEATTRPDRTAARATMMPCKLPHATLQAQGVEDKVCKLESQVRASRAPLHLASADRHGVLMAAGSLCWTPNAACSRGSKGTCG